MDRLQAIDHFQYNRDTEDNYDESPLPELVSEPKRNKASDKGISDNGKDIQATPLKPLEISRQFEQDIYGTENKPMVETQLTSNLPHRVSIDQEDQNLVEDEYNLKKSYSDRKINNLGENELIRESKTFEVGNNKLNMINVQKEEDFNEDFLPEIHDSYALERKNETIMPEAEEEEAPKFKFPEGKCSKVLFIIFFPIHVLMHYCLPKIRYKPSLSKILITCIFLFVLQVIFA